MKKILLLIGVAALLATVSTQAQTPIYAPSVVSLPSVFSAGTTNLASPPVLYVGKQGNAAFESTIAGTSAGVTNVYYFAPSVSGVYFDTNAAEVVLFTNSVVSGATNTVTKNLSAAGIGYFKLFSVVTTGTATNVAHYYPTKLSAP